MWPQKKTAPEGAVLAGKKKSAPRRRRLGGGNSAAPPKVAFRFRYDAKMQVSYGDKRKAPRPFAEESVAKMGLG